MGLELVTLDDLEQFRLQLLKDIEHIVRATPPKKWLRTQEVMELLGISEVTLQTLRNNGSIPYRKLGGICYYHIDELDQAINNVK